MEVTNTIEMQNYLKRIKISEYSIIGNIIRINLNNQQIYYRMNADNQIGITMENSKEYTTLFNKIFNNGK